MFDIQRHVGDDAIDVLIEPASGDLAMAESKRPQGMPRRNVLRTLGGAAGMLAARPLFTIAAEGAKGANDRIGVGFIGVGGRAGSRSPSQCSWRSWRPASS